MMEVWQDIDTPHLRIRRMRLADADFAASLWGDPQVGRYLGDRPYADGYDLRRDIADMDDWEDQFMFIAAERETGEDVGTCSVGQEGDGDQWGWGYCVRPDRWSRGYATEMGRAMLAFARARGIRRFRGTVATENAASCRVMEKLGMRVKEHSSFKKQGTDITYASSIYTLEDGDEPRTAQ